MTEVKKPAPVLKAPTLPLAAGLSGGGLATTFQTEHAVTADTGDRIVTVPWRSESLFPAAAGAIYVDFPFKRMGPGVFSAGIEGGAASGPSYTSYSATPYARYSLRFAGDHVRVDGRLGGAVMRHDRGDAKNWGFAGDAAIIGHINIFGGGKTNFFTQFGIRFLQKISQAQATVGIEIPLDFGGSPTISPDDITVGEGNIRRARKKYEELRNLCETATSTMVSAWGDNIKLLDRMFIAEAYIEWITNRDSKGQWTASPSPDAPPINKSLRIIAAFMAAAQEVLPTTDVWRIYAGEQMEEDLKRLEVYLMQPALDVLFLRTDSLFDRIKTLATETQKSIAKNDLSRAQDLFKEYKDQLERFKNMYTSIRYHIPAEQKIKLPDIQRHLDCLTKGSMCLGILPEISLPELDKALQKAKKGPEPDTGGNT